jgi:HipA-like protein
MNLFRKKTKILLRYGSHNIGELWSDGSRFAFTYLPDFFDLDLSPLSGLPDPVKNKTYKNDELWPFFALRIPDLNREDVRDLLRQKKLTASDKLELLASLGRETINNPFSLAPAR